MGIRYFEKDSETIDRRLVGNNPTEENTIEYYGTFAYVDDYLRELNNRYPVKDYNFKKLLSDEEEFNKTLTKSLDISVSSHMSTHSSIIYRLLEVAELHEEWRGYTLKREEPVWFLEELIKEESSRLTASQGNRGMRELLVSGYCYSPNIEKKSDFDDTVIIVPSQKLVKYLVNLSS